MEDSTDPTTLPPVRVSQGLKFQLAQYAKSQERDMSWVIRKAIIEYLSRHREET